MRIDLTLMLAVTATVAACSGTAAEPSSKGNGVSGTPATVAPAKGTVGDTTASGSGTPTTPVTPVGGGNGTSGGSIGGPVTPVPGATDASPVDVDAGASGGADGGDIDADAAPVCSKTLYTDIQPILQAKCESCHAADGFTQSCASAQDVSDTISSFVASGKMPKRGKLTADEKAAILKWVSDGALCGPDC